FDISFSFQTTKVGIFIEMTKNFDFFIHCPALPKGYACGFSPSGRHRSLHCARQPRNAAGVFSCKIKTDIIWRFQNYCVLLQT
ncbi:MAG: hypothetical protein SO064_08220, partial [Prevotella sp.]|nr:hypothetical protein [Prevotella sp.]